MGRLPENYIGVDTRILEFRQKYGDAGSIEIDTTYFEKNAAFLIKATIKNGDKILGQGQAFSVIEEDADKFFEKTESAAVGRALKHAGFAALDLDESVPSQAPKTANKPSSGLGGGGLGGSAKKTPVASTSTAKPAAKTTAPKPTPKVTQSVVESESDDLDADALLSNFLSED